MNDASAPHVLIVEDEESAADVLATILELEGFHVTTAANGKRALDILPEVRPALIITDYMMPIMDGIELAQKVRQMPNYADIPILMTTGVAEAAVKPYASLLSAYLRKPFHMDALLATIDRLLRRERRDE